MKKFKFISILLCVLCFISSNTVSEEEWMPDPNLRKAVRGVLEIPTYDPLTPEKLETLKELKALDSQISDLTGLEFATNLSALILSGNKISDLTPLSSLSMLVWLDLPRNKIVDVTPLSGLKRLEVLKLWHNQIIDITPLTGLTNLRVLELADNQIEDFSPLAALTNLEILTVQRNVSVDISPIPTANLIEFIYDKSCDLDRIPIEERVVNRDYPSVFGAWSHELLNHPIPDNIWEWSYYKNMLAQHDLYWGGANLGIQWRFFTPEEMDLFPGGELQLPIERKNQILSKNPNYLHLISLYYYGANPLAYPEDWPYWLRDENGNRIQDIGWDELLIDWTHPGAQDHFVQQAVAIAKCGIFDGIFMDWWDESEQWDQEMAALYHDSKVDGLVSLVKRIREAVADELLIIVNTNTRKIPRSAPYVNGSFMETIGSVKGYSRERLIEIENALSWYEENFKYPQVNCLEGWGIPSEPLDSPRNQQQARVFTTLSLTHSNGYVSYVTGIRIGSNHEHAYEIWEGHTQEHASGEFGGHTHQKYWYPFYDAPLGRPVGAKGQLYENREGVFIREFTNGWAVYNRSGKEQKIRLPMPAIGVESGITSRTHTLPDLDGEIYLKQETGTSADVNDDGVVNIQDLVIVANAFGKAEPDLNGDGVVNIQDLVIVANAFGED